jgi:hypothetical protein
VKFDDGNAELSSEDEAFIDSEDISLNFLQRTQTDLYTDPETGETSIVNDADDAMKNSTTKTVTSIAERTRENQSRDHQRCFSTKASRIQAKRGLNQSNVGDRA